MDAKHALRFPVSARARAAVASAALVALVALALGCDPMARPGDGSAGDSGSQQGSGDIFDAGGGSGSTPRDCGGGPYRFTISASDVDPWQQSGEVDPQGITELFLWKATGQGLAAVAGDFEIQETGEPGTYVAFSAVAPNLNIDREGLQQVFLAVGGCLSGPVLLGRVTVYGRPDTFQIRLAALAPGSVAVDCCATKPGWPIACDWFQAVFPDTTAADSTGADSTGAGA